MLIINELFMYMQKDGSPCPVIDLMEVTDEYSSHWTDMTITPSGQFYYCLYTPIGQYSTLAVIM